MIKAKQAFYWTCNSRGYDFHGNKATILCLIARYYSYSSKNNRQLPLAVVYWVLDICKYFDTQENIRNT